MPAWYTVPELAQRFGMALNAYLAWCEYGEGTWWTARVRQAQAIEMACLQAALQRPRPAPLPPGYVWGGGPTDPEATCYFVDDDEGAA